MRRKPEILAPAGDMEKLQMAVLYGADAVYLAGTSFGMRSFAGNFTPEEAGAFLSRLHEASAPGDSVLIGIDLIKDAQRLEAAYDDPLGVTAAFNLNLLLQTESGHPRWQEGQRAIREAKKVMSAKEYIRFYRRDSVRDHWKPVAIDLANA